jgi:hypothetical protein
MAYCLRKAEIANLIALCGFCIIRRWCKSSANKKAPLDIGALRHNGSTFKK